MAHLTPGANASVPVGDLSVVIRCAGIPEADIDVSAFLLASNGRVRSDADMCFYGQPVIADGAVGLSKAGNDETRFTISPENFPPEVEKVVFTATIHENRVPFAKVPEISLDIGDVHGRISCVGMTETALILAELYKRNGDWKIRIVGQGFNGGLNALASHLGVEIATEEQDQAKTLPPSRAKQSTSTPVSLTKVTLTKTGASSHISLAKRAGGIVKITATWIDNGDNRADNDDLDLRAGILMPDGSMHWLAASHPGTLQDMPYARHMGDVLGASKDAPGTEIIEVDPSISHKLGGPVAMVFSVYSAVSNGAVSIASLRPVMSVEHAGNIVNCEFGFPDGNAAKGVYTYVIGTILIDKNDLEVRLSGLTSRSGSENTPWIERHGSEISTTFDGSPVFKKGRTMLARMMGSKTRKYANL